MITSTANAQVKDVINLIKKSGERKNRGLFVIEGIRMFREIPSRYIHKIYASESFACENRSMLSEYEYETVSDKVFSQMSDTKTPQGIMAVVKMPKYTMADITDRSENPLMVILENIQDPGNLGTIVRTAEGAGASGIIMSKNTVDIFNPKTIRSTMGSLFRVPFIYVEDITTAMEELHEKNIATYAAYLEGSMDYCEPDYSRAGAIIIGNEGNGLTKETAKLAKNRIRIPMGGKLESLNAAISAAVIMYEAARQRRI